VSIKPRAWNLQVQGELARSFACFATLPVKDMQVEKSTAGGCLGQILPEGSDEGALTLLLYSLRRIRTLIVAVGLLLARLPGVSSSSWRVSIQASNAFSQLEALIPPFAREMMGRRSWESCRSMAWSVSGTSTSRSLGLFSASGHRPRHHRNNPRSRPGFIDLILSRPCRATGSSLEPSLRSPSPSLLWLA